MINVYLCEDEEVQLKYFRKQIAWYLQHKKKDTNFISAETNPEKIVEIAEKNSDVPSIFFIDIALDGYSMDGFELVQELQSINNMFGFVFLTARSELAYKVFDYNLEIIDYIVKNPEYFLADNLSEDVIRRLDRIFDQYEDRIRQPENSLFIETSDNSKYFVQQEQIMYIRPIEKESHYCEIVCADRYLKTKKYSLKAFAEKLDDSFLLLNRSCIVSIRYIQGIQPKKGIILMENGIEFKIPRRKIKEVCEEIERKKNL